MNCWFTMFCNLVVLPLYGYCGSQAVFLWGLRVPSNLIFFQQGAKSLENLEKKRITRADAKVSEDCSLHLHQTIFLKKLEDISPFISLFWTCVTSILDYKDRVDSLACMLPYLCRMDSSDSSRATPAEVLMASMAAKLLFIIITTQV